MNQHPGILESEITADFPDESKFRHPWETPIFIFSVFINVAIMAGALILANASAEWLAFHPFIHRHINKIRILAMAAVFVLPAVVFIRNIRRASILGNSVRLSRDQLPEIHQLLEGHCARLGTDQVPELYLTDKAVPAPSQAFSTWHRDCIALSARFIERKPEKSRDVLSFMLARELGRLRLGHTRPLYEVLLAYMSRIPYLRNPLTQVQTLSHDRYGAYLEPNAVPGLMILASGRRLLGLVKAQDYLDSVADYKGFWTVLSNLNRQEPHISFRVRALNKAGLLHFDPVAYEAKLEQERLDKEKKDKHKHHKDKEKDKHKVKDKKVKDKANETEQSRRIAAH